MESAHFVSPHRTLVGFNGLLASRARGLGPTPFHSLDMYRSLYVASGALQERGHSLEIRSVVKGCMTEVLSPAREKLQVLSTLCKRIEVVQVLMDRMMVLSAMNFMFLNHKDIRMRE